MENRTMFEALEAVPELRGALEASASMCDNGMSLPPVVAVLSPAVELEPMMDGLCSELDSMGLVRFTGNRRWLNIGIEHPELDGFGSMERMMAKMRHAAGYHNRFGGVVKLDLTAWMDSADDKRMDELMGFIHDYRSEMFFIITMRTTDPEAAEPMIKLIRKWFYATEVTVNATQAHTFMSIMTRRLQAMQCSLSVQAGVVIAETIDRLMKEEDFAGVKEIESLANAILFKVGRNTVVTTEEVAEFAASGEWMRRRSNSRHTTIGFEGGSSNEYRQI